MAGIYGVLHVGKQALLTHQEALNVTAHNIANVNTPGYSRQRVVMETTTPITTGAGQVGSGVTVSGIERVYDRYLNNQISNENETLGRWEAEKGGVERVEVVFNETSGYGLNAAMSEFWNGWQDLANNPSGHTERETLLAKGETLADNFQQSYNDLSAIRTELDNSISQTVGQINVKADQIADLNQKIVQIEANGDTANDYRDERDLALKELSLMIDITASEQNSGSVTVTLGDGENLVEGSTASDLSTMTNSAGFRDVVWDSAPTTSINSDISGGKLKGWLEVRDVTIPGYLENMENLVNSIKGVEATKVTAKAASDLTGGEYFTLSSPTTDYYVWYDIKDGSADPSIVGSTGIEVDILATDTAEQVATKTAAAIAAEADFDAPPPTGTTLTITNVVAGAVTDSAVGTSGFTISKLTDGGNGVNTFHRDGFGIDAANSTDNDFFTGTLGGNDFGVDSDISGDVNKIAASGTLAGVPGDNSNAISIANLQNTLTMNSNTDTFDDYYNSVVSSVGREVQQANSRYDHQYSMVAYLDNYRESISGVSLDEEMLNMLQFESAYEAAAKLISKVDEMLQTLMGMI